jgi:diacylglycerol kinase (ATP)
VKKVLVIANPYAGTSAKNNLRDTLLRSNSDFFDLEFKFTEGPEHAKVLAKDAVAKGLDIVLAAGGDGTVNEVASQLVFSNTILGILPGGSGNGFAMHLGLGRDAEKAFEIIKQGKVLTADTCLVNERFFINVSGIGFDARIAYLTKQSKKRGFGHYFKTTLTESKKFVATPLVITHDGGEVEGRFASVVIANASMYGYNFTIAPSAAIDDGMFDIMLIHEAPVYKYFMASYNMITKTLDKTSFAQTFKSKTVSVKMLAQDYYHVDGEGLVLDQDLHYSINPLSIQVIGK